MGSAPSSAGGAAAAPPEADKSTATDALGALEKKSGVAAAQLLDMDAVKLEDTADTAEITLGQIIERAESIGVDAVKLEAAAQQADNPRGAALSLILERATAEDATASSGAAAKLETGPLAKPAAEPLGEAGLEADSKADSKVEPEPAPRPAPGPAPAPAPEPEPAVAPALGPGPGPGPEPAPAPERNLEPEPNVELAAADGKATLAGLEGAASSSASKSTPSISRPSWRAVTLDALLSFTRDHDLWEKPTWWVVENVVKPLTTMPPAAEDPETQGIRGVELPCFENEVGKTDVFVSHAWGNTFGLLVTAAADFANDIVNGEGEFTDGMGGALEWTSGNFRRIAQKRLKALSSSSQPGKKLTPVGRIRFWVDILAIMQHVGAGNTADIKNLGDVVKESRCTLMVLDQKQAMPFTRAWCLYELAVTLESFEKTKKKTIEVSPKINGDRVAPKIQIKLKPNHVFYARAGRVERAEDGVPYFEWANAKALRKINTNLDMENAQAKFPRDLEMIKEKTRKLQIEGYGTGFKAINKMGRLALMNLLSYQEL